MGEFAQHHLQNAAMEEVLDFRRRVDSHQCREFQLRSILPCHLDRRSLPGRNAGPMPEIEKVSKPVRPNDCAELTRARTAMAEFPCIRDCCDECARSSAQ